MHVYTHTLSSLPSLMPRAFRYGLCGYCHPGIDGGGDGLCAMPLDVNDLRPDAVAARTCSRHMCSVPGGHRVLLQDLAPRTSGVQLPAEVAHTVLYGMIDEAEPVPDWRAHQLRGCAAD